MVHSSQIWPNFQKVVNIFIFPSVKNLNMTTLRAQFIDKLVNQDFYGFVSPITVILLRFFTLQLGKSV